MKQYPDVDAYLRESEQWPDEIAAIRPLLIDSGLEESIKWGKPTYSHDGDNICILQEMKDFLAVMFFKGALLEDPAGLLHSQGPNSRSAKRFQFTSVAEIHDSAGMIAAYVADAIDVAVAGLEVEPAPDQPLAEELQDRLDADPALRAAFEALTPGRQRAYNLNISEAKQSATRARRVEKWIPKILEGKGPQDR